MNKTGKIILALVVVVALIAAAFWLMRDTNTAENNTTPTNESSSTTETSDEASTATPQTTSATILYGDNGFEVASITVKMGDEIKVTNNSGSVLKFASNPHPVHTDKDELNLGDISPGQSKTFTITQKGTWGFHNHSNASHGGTIVVE